MMILVAMLSAFLWVAPSVIGDSKPTFPSALFALQDVEFSVARSAPMSTQGRSITINGKGQGTVVCYSFGGKSERLSFQVPQETMVSLLEEAIRRRFFELNYSYTAQYSLYEKEEGLYIIGLGEGEDIEVTYVTLRIGDATYRSSYLDGWRDSAPYILVHVAETLERLYSEAEPEHTPEATD